MDKLLLQLTIIALLSAIIGLMDKVKHQWTSTWFSTVLQPKWLAQWLNPHYTLQTNSKILQVLFKYVLAAVGDFWHFLKAIMLQLIFILAWVSYHEANFWVWLLVCNTVYGVLFEVVFSGCFNKKSVKQSLSDIISQAEILYPVPAFTLWYHRFPQRAYVVAMLVPFTIGFIVHVNGKSPLIPFIVLALMLLFIGTIHTIAWIKMRRVEQKRAKYISSHP